MKRNHLVLAVISVIIVAAVGAFAVSTMNKPRVVEANKPFRVAFNTWLGYSSFYIAEAQGLFKKYGVEVQTTVIDPLDQKNAALARGDLDAMGGTIDSSIISAAADVDGKIVFMFDRSNGTDGILTTTDVATVADLKGHSVAVEEGFSGHFFLLYALEKANLTARDVKLVPMTTDQAGAAFAAGQVDAAMTWEPYLTTALQRKNSKVLMSSRELEPILADTLFVSKAALEHRSREVQAVVEALAEANDYWIAHPAEGNAIAAARWKMADAEVAKTMATVELYGTDRQLAQFGIGKGAELLGYLMKCASLWLSAGVIKKPVNAEGLVDSTYVAALKH